MKPTKNQKAINALTEIERILQTDENNLTVVLQISQIVMLYKEGRDFAE